MNLKSIRLSLGMTQAAFAEALGVSRNYIALIEMGKRNPSEGLLSLVNNLVGSRSAQSEQNQPQVDTPRGGAAGLEARLSAVEERLAAVERLLLRLAADADRRSGT